jgi:predicted dehydrogenase
MQNSPNNRIQIALIGAGGMGMGDTRIALGVPEMQLVAAADVYDGRLTRVKEIWGKDIFTTRDHREILARPDVDAVIIATPDHWHATITREALNAGKHVYCEKPMVHSVDEGPGVIEAQKKSGRILQIGSQYASSSIIHKMRDLLAQGAIGKLNMVEAWLDRNTAMGAWQYSIPPDASLQTVDWDRFLGKAPKRPFEPIRLFRWRNYNDYGTGLAGDLFVHLLTGLHVVTNSLGPERIYAVGGTRYWKDGRDAPDVMLGTMDYPETDKHPAFTLMLRVNFKSSLAEESFGFRFVGSEGTMTTDMSKLELTKQPRETEPGFTLDAFPKRVQDAILKEYHEKYPPKRPSADTLRAVKTQSYSNPPGGDAHREHHRNFYRAIRDNKPFFEDGVFGFRAAGPALLCNASYFGKKQQKWDPVGMKAVS